MNEIGKEWVSFQTCGRIKEGFLFFPIPCMCGSITDGIAINFTGEEGSFVIDFKDLLEMVKLAKQARSLPDE